MNLPSHRHRESPRIATLLTCYNRREKTLDCLRALKSLKSHEYSIEVFLVDDGSTDKTSEGVQIVWPQATIIPGNGNLFWCGGMRKAWSEAAKADPDYYLLLNDDTLVDPSALADLLSIVGSPDSLIIATGAVMDPTTQKQIYGGHRRRGRELVAVTGKPERCETMNANCALVPRAVFEKIGMFHPAYTHSMGDFDYGFEANRRGISVYQTGNIIARCHGNSASGSWRDPLLSRHQRWKLLRSPKGLPLKEWLIYTRRNEGILWPAKFFGPILRVLIGR